MRLPNTAQTCWKLALVALLFTACDAVEDDASSDTGETGSGSTQADLSASETGATEIDGDLPDADVPKPGAPPPALGLAGGPVSSEGVSKLCRPTAIKVGNNVADGSGGGGGNADGGSTSSPTRPCSK